MADPPGPPHDEALRRFDERYDALAASHGAKRAGMGLEGGASAGYRLIGELIGGVLAGLGLGWVVDRFAGTAPIGLICGLLVGTGAAIFVAVRSAMRMSAATPTIKAPAPAPADVEDGSDDGA